MSKKIISLLLAVLTAAAVLASCGNGGNGGETTGTAAPSGEQSENEFAEIDAYVQNLAASYDVAGKTFSYCGPSSLNFPTEDKETGDIQSDAVYYRHRELVELFGINWEPVATDGGADAKDRIIQDVTAGSNEYDLTCGGMLTCGQALLNAGVLTTVNDLEYVDLDREWWVQSMRDTFSVHDKLYFLFGPIVPYTYLDTHCMIFNKSLASMFNVDESSLYTTASAGGWTLDEMERVASAVPTVTSPTTGVYRYIHPVGVPFLFACGLTITKFDEDDTPYVDDSISVELSNLADRLSAIQSDVTQTGYVYKDEVASTKLGVEKMEDLFDDNRSLFYFCDTGDISWLRQRDVQFGILPMPKLNGAQKSYRSYSNPWVGTAVYFPKNVKDRTMSDLICEALAALSQKYVKTAYYDKMLRSQAIFDLESQEMLEIIFGTKIYDMSVLYSQGSENSWGPFLDCIENALGHDSSTFASDYKSAAKVTKFNIKDLIRTVDNDG